MPDSSCLSRRLQRQCVSCKKKFRPHARLGARQKTCGLAACKMTHGAVYRKIYRAQNPEPEYEYQQKRKEIQDVD